MKKLTLTTLCAAILMTVNVQASDTVDVTPENYNFAVTDKAFQVEANLGGINQFHHHRNVMALDQQPAVTMNRDTVYSFAIVNAVDGLKLQMPKTKDGRYLSAMVLQNDSYIDQVFYGAGTYEVIADTDFVAIGVRIQIDPNDEKDVAYVNELQDQLKLIVPEGVKLKEWKPTHWNSEQIKTLTKKYTAQADQLEDFSCCSGARDTIKMEDLRKAVSVATGLLPAKDATYLYRSYNLDNKSCYVATYTKPKFGDKGFFSYTMYGEDRYLHTDEHVNLNSSNLTYNDDGSFTVYYGNEESCGDVDNLLETPTDNWYLGVRVYRPDQSVLDGEWVLPKPEKVSK